VKAAVAAGKLVTYVTFIPSSIASLFRIALMAERYERPFILPNSGNLAPA